MNEIYWHFEYSSSILITLFNAMFFIYHLSLTKGSYAYISIPKPFAISATYFPTFPNA